MRQIIVRTLRAAAAGAVLVLLVSLVFVELIQPRVFPHRPGQGHNSTAMLLYMFGGPCGAGIGGYLGLVVALYRWGNLPGLPGRDAVR